MEKMVWGFADKSIQTHYANALDKVKASLRTAQKEKFEHLDNNIKFQLPPCINNDYEYLSVLQNAVSAKCIIGLKYKNTKEEVSSRMVEPLGLIFYAFNWHLIAWCHKRQEYRDFRVNRILKINPTGLPFQKSDHMALSDYMKMLPVSY